VTNSCLTVVTFHKAVIKCFYARSLGAQTAEKSPKPYRAKRLVVVKPPAISR